MDYSCEVCDKVMKSKNQYRHFKSIYHKELDKCKHNLSIRNLDKNSRSFLFFLYC